MASTNGADGDLEEQLWSLRSSAAAVDVRIDLLRKTWPRSPPEWLEEEEARDLLRPHVEVVHLPLLIHGARTAPSTWRDGARLRTRTLLSLVEPCELHVLKLRLDAIFGLSQGGWCHLRLRLGEAGHWMESSDFWIASAPASFSDGRGCFFEACNFEFQIPISSGDSLASLFQGPRAKGLEVQLVDASDATLLHGELSALELLARLEAGPAISCIQLGPVKGLQSCSVPGLLEGPRLQLELVHSHAAAPLDAVPYWMAPGDVKRSREKAETGPRDGQEAENRTDRVPHLQLSMRSLSPMPGALEKVMGRVNLETGHGSFRLHAVAENGEVICSADAGASTGVIQGCVELVLELMVSHEGADLLSLTVWHQPLPFQLLGAALGSEAPAPSPLLAAVPLGAWGKVELELAPVPQLKLDDACDEAHDSSELADATEEAEAEPMEAEDAHIATAEIAAATFQVEVATAHGGEETDLEHPPASSAELPADDSDGNVSEEATSSGLANVSGIAELEQWLDDQSPRALFSKVVEVAQLAVDMVSKPKAAETSPLARSPVLRLDGNAARDSVGPTIQSWAPTVAEESPGAGTVVPEDIGVAEPCLSQCHSKAGGCVGANHTVEVTAKDGGEELESTTASNIDLSSKHALGHMLRPWPPWREPPDEPEPAAEESLGEAEHLKGEVRKSSGAAPLPKKEHRVDRVHFTPGTGAGVPPPKSLEAPAENILAASATASGCQLGGRGPLPPDLMVHQKPGLTTSLPRDLVTEPMALSTAKLDLPPTAPMSEEFQSPEPEDLPMVSFLRPMQTLPMSPAASAVSAVESETPGPLTSRPDEWCATQPWPHGVPEKPRWAMTWTSSPSEAWRRTGATAASAWGSTRSTACVTPRQRLEELASVKAPLTKPVVSRPQRWSDRIDVNTKRLAKIMRSAEESSDSSG